ncbi:MAG: transporter substrate-binding domain-containing protein [Dehalococcoidia bacterium]|nr:transporter substrate-binding domain-containing protein [Dehalococcoidia bacterium]
MVGLLGLACEDNGDGEGSGKLQAVIDRGELRCGVNDGVPGFGFLEPDGSFSGFDVDFCRAVAAAVLGDAEAVEYIPLSAGARFDALVQDEIDVLIRNTTWTAERDGAQGAAFTLTTFYDGQGMMVRSESGITSIDDMEGITVCVLRGTTTEGNLEDRFALGGISYTPLAFEDLDTLEAAFREERCDGWTSDQSQLAARRSSYPAEAGGPDSLTVLSEVFSKEPLGPAVRDGDDEWFDVVNWVVIGMIQADELGVGSDNVEEQISEPSSIDVARLLGVPWEGGEDLPDFALGVDRTFMQEVLRQVGNYDEVYERNIVPLGIPREGTLNASWREGGILYAPPMR